MDSPSVFPVQEMSNKLCNKCVTIKSADDDKNNSLNQSNIILNSVHHHNYFITQGNYIGYMFQLLINHLQAYFCQLSPKMLCTLWM